MKHLIASLLVIATSTHFVSEAAPFAKEYEVSVFLAATEEAEKTLFLGPIRVMHISGIVYDAPVAVQYGGIDDEQYRLAMTLISEEKGIRGTMLYSKAGENSAVFFESAWDEENDCGPFVVLAKKIESPIHQEPILRPDEDEGEENQNEESVETAEELPA